MPLQRMPLLTPHDPEFEPIPIGDPSTPDPDADPGRCSRARWPVQHSQEFSEELIGAIATRLGAEPPEMQVQILQAIYNRVSGMLAAHFARRARLALTRDQVADEPQEHLPPARGLVSRARIAELYDRRTRNHW